MRRALSIFLILFLTAFLRAEVIEDYTGKDVSEFYSAKNYDLVVLNYWAVYCLPCKREMPDFDKLYKKYKDKNVLVLGASIDSNEKASFIKKLIKKLEVEYPIVYGVAAEFRGIDVTGLPKTFIMDKEGKILKEIDGQRDFEYFDEILEECLKNNVASKEVKKEAVSQSDYYYFGIAKVDGKKEIELRMGTRDGIHLNGEGYPKLTLELESQEVFENVKVSLEVDGIDDGAEKVWTMAVKDYKKGDKIKVKVKAIACTDSTCRQLKDEFEWILAD